MNSMERRLQVGLALLLALLTFIFWAAINRSIHALVEDYVAARLAHDSVNMLMALEPDPQHTRVRWRRVSDIYNKVDSGHYYVFKFDDGRTISSPSLWDKHFSLQTVSGDQPHQYRTDGPNNEPLLVWAKRFSKDKQNFTLYVAEDLTLIRQHRDRFKRNFALLAAAAFGLLLLLQTLLLRSSFRRLDQVQTDMALLREGKRDRLTTDLPDEVRPLVVQFNALLEQMTSRLERSRNALGNLAHALKGPLNLLVQSLRSPDDENSRQEAEAQTERIRHLIERELKRARLAGNGASHKRFDAAQEMPDLIVVLRQLHRDKTLDIDCKVADDLPPFNDREDMLELVGNLFDNACKWAAQKIRCRIRLDGDYRITVEDDGKGLSDAEIERLAQRGVRLDESIEGSGLGLAISKDIVGLYGGSLIFTRSEKLGGLRVEVHLPAAH